MRFKSQKLAGLIITLLALAMILPVNAFDDEQTRHIELTDRPGSDADSFVTEAGLGYSTSLVTITDPNMDIYAYLFFEDIKINYWHHLINATLRLHTASSMSFDADSSVTIYGVDDYIHFGSGTKGYGPFGAPSDIMNAPLTTAHVDYNTSQFYGSQWWEIDVTNIVQELKSNPNWDGPGTVKADPGDNMAFIFLSSEGYDTRYFYDLKAGNGFEAQLNLHWTSTPCPPSGYEDYVFNESYGDFDIWQGNVTGWLDYTAFIETDTDNLYTVENSTYVFTTDNVWGDSPVQLYSEDDSTLFDIKFGIDLTYFRDQDATASRFWIMLYWGRENPGYAIGASDCDFFGIGLQSDQTESKVEPYFYAYNTTNGYLDPLGIEYTDPWKRWNHFTFDMSTRQYSWKMYTDMEMTILDAEFSGTHTLSNLDQSEHIYALNTHSTGYQKTDKGQFKLLSRVNSEGFIISLNGTVIMDNGDPLKFDTIEEIEEWIDHYDPDPDDPDPAGEWGTTGPFTRFKLRLYSLILGFGCLFGPVLFFSWRRPSAYYLMVGAIIMIAGLGLLMFIGDI